MDRQPPQSDRPIPRFTDVDPFRAALDRVAPPRSPQLPRFDPPPRSPQPPPPPSDYRPSDHRPPEPPRSSAPPPPPLDHWSRPSAPRPIPNFSGRPARSLVPNPGRRASGRRRSPLTLRRVLEWGDRLFRGKLLFWLFGAWALLWLLGGVAMVGLITIDQRPLPPKAPAIASPAPPRAEMATAPAPTFGDDTPMAGQAQGRDRPIPMTTPLPASRPPVALFAGAAVLCGLGSWVRLRQFQRSPAPRSPHRLPR